MRKRVWVPAAVGVVTFAYFFTGRDYPLVLALLVGAAVMLLGWASVRTWDQLRGLRR
ncbi:MAG: hypothetical protein R3244_01200 [Thermoanaerobaculia bacterium]|nr:hypothetical protein [Thermoanaerobaculia bacterium]